MPCRELSRDHLFACPEDFNLRVEILAELLEITFRSIAEHSIEYGIVRVITRTRYYSRCLCSGCGPVNDLDLAFCKFFDIATDVIEKDRDIIGANCVEELQLACQRRSSGIVETIEQLERTEADAEPHSGCTAMDAERFELLRGRHGMRRLP